MRWREREREIERATVSGEIAHRTGCEGESDTVLGGRKVHGREDERPRASRLC